MNRLTLDEKAGFVASQPFEILDSRGILFYSSDFTKKIREGKKLFFNVPRGTYFVKGTITQLKNPIVQRLPKLPKPERNIPKDGEFKIEFGDNINKCSIFYGEHRILFDKEFLQKPEYVLFFVLYHELGHLRYKSETGADAYARNMMLRRGYNRSQIGMAVLSTLSSKKRNFERKNRIVNDLM